MSEKKFNYVYLTINIINGKQYIGDHSTNNINDNYLGSGRPYLKNAIKKYGKENFKKEILEFFPSKQKSFDAQEKYIQQYNTLYPNGYNLSPSGGLQCSPGWSEESKKKISLSKKGKPSNNKGRSLSKEAKEKIKNSKLGKTHSKEHNINIGKSLKGKNKDKKRSEEFKEKIRIFQKGRKKSEETKQKMRKPLSEEAKRKISKAGKGRIPWNKGKKLK